MVDVLFSASDVRRLSQLPLASASPSTTGTRRAAASRRRVEKAPAPAMTPSTAGAGEMVSSLIIAEERHFNLGDISRKIK